jgi:hypothetical protein
MECLLTAILSTCFSWANLYIDNEISYQDRSVPYHYWKEVSPTPSATGAVETSYLSTIGHESQNPYYRAAIGIRIPLRSIDLSAEVFHDSSISSDKDRGVNGVAIRATWFPFR